MLKKGECRLLSFELFSSKQRDLYDETFRDLVESVLDGFNGTVFAYGQTGTGKTFTMQGKQTSTYIVYKFNFQLNSLWVKLKSVKFTK